MLLVLRFYEIIKLIFQLEKLFKILNASVLQKLTLRIDVEDITFMLCMSILPQREIKNIFDIHVLNNIVFLNCS